MSRSSRTGLVRGLEQLSAMTPAATELGCLFAAVTIERNGTPCSWGTGLSPAAARRDGRGWLRASGHNLGLPRRAPGDDDARIWVIPLPFGIMRYEDDKWEAGTVEVLRRHVLRAARKART